MFNLLDLTFIILLFIVVATAYRRGLLLTLLSLVSGVFSLVVVWLVMPQVSKWLIDIGVFSGATKSIESGITARLSAAGTGIADALGGLGIPKAWQGAITDKSAAAGADAVSAVANSVTQILASAAVVVLGFIVLNLVVRFIAKPIAAGINRIPLIGTVNRIGGLLAGLVFGAILVYIAVVLLNALVPAVPSLKEPLAGSSIAKALAGQDLFASIANDVLKLPAAMPAPTSIPSST